MKRVVIRLVVPVLTFIVGIAVATVWLQKPYKRFADDIYFPAGIFLPREGGMNWFVKFYSSSLMAMQEPPISTLEGDEVEVYRLLFLPPFDPPRITRSAAVRPNNSTHPTADTPPVI